MSSHPTFGVEEEFLLVDPDNGEPVARNATVAERAAKARGVDLQLELTSCQVETATEVADSSEQLRDELTRLRRIAAEAADGRRRTTARRRAAADGPARVSDHRQAALPQDRRAVRDDRPRAGHLRLPCARRRPRPRSRDPGEQSVAAVAAAAAGADREFSGLPQRRHRIRQLAQHPLGSAGPVRDRHRSSSPPTSTTPSCECCRRRARCSTTAWSIGMSVRRRTSRRSRCASPMFPRPLPRPSCSRRWSGAL